MNPFKPAGALIVFFITVLLSYGGPGTAGAHETGRAYVVLGDSIEFGIGASSPANAWVPMFHEYLEATFFGTPEAPVQADLHNHAVSGATAGDIMRDQLAPAIADIQGHNPVVVSWGGGGDDLLNFIGSPQAATCLRGDASCLARLNALLNEVERVLDVTVRRLRAAGPNYAILLRTQYNPLLRTSCGGPTDPQAQLANLVLEGGAPFLVGGLNDRIRDVAARYGAKVIEIFLPFYLNPDDLVADDCIHPNDAGHAVIQNAAAIAF